LAAGCSAIGRVLSPPSIGGSANELVGSAARASSGLEPLAWVGCVCILCGAAALVFSRGTSGWRAVCIGVACCVIAVAVANFLSWLLVPVLVGTGFISLAWSAKTVRDIWNSKNGRTC